jgi:enoyl-CoA hydratase/carnithine racemase
VFEHIRYEVVDPVATITLHRPEAMNAWTARMSSELRDAIARAEADSSVVGIVITGAGRGFCAGADLNVLSDLAGGGPGDGVAATSSAAERPDPDDFSSTYTFLLGCTKPLIAAINGPVAGMAVPLVLCCDLRFMAESAVVVSAFAQRGLIAEWGLSWLLPRLVGPGAALDILFSSRRITGSEAESMGLVNRCLPDDELIAHCRTYVEHLAEHCSPTSMAIMKRQVYEQLHRGLGRAELESQRLMVESFERPDFAEGVASFLEKRPPRFGRLGS